MSDRSVPHRWAMLPLVTLSLVSATSCDVINPALLGSTGGSTIRALENAQGSLVILVMNRTTAVAAAQVLVTKQSGGTVLLTIPVQEFGDGNDRDFSAIVQDCDIEQVQLLQVTAVSGEGETVEVPSDAPPLRMGIEINCGSVIAITVSGTSPTLFLDLTVF